ncbi:MAG: DUF488 family protein [Candidatus Hodarchaeota archaeon]
MEAANVNISPVPPYMSRPLLFIMENLGSGGMRTCLGEMIIYTIGTSNRECEEFIALLEMYGIKLLADVRRFPTSKFEWFKKENLAKILARHQIGYLFLGTELGGYRKGGYEAYTSTESFHKGLKKIETIASYDKVAVMCSERSRGNATGSLLQ